MSQMGKEMSQARTFGLMSQMRKEMSQARTFGLMSQMGKEMSQIKAKTRGQASGVGGQGKQ